MSDKILKVIDVIRTYKLSRRSIPVLKGIELEVSEGEWVALLGASGSGKTTLLNLIGLLEKPDGGKIIYKEKDCSKLSKSALTVLRRKNIGFVFQFYHLLPELTVLENIKVAAMLNGKITKDAADRSKELLSYVGLEDRFLHKPGELSGGEQQRAAIARSLINDPELILADEPTGNLDSETGEEIINLFEELNKKHSKTILMVTHDKEVAERANRITVIKDGKIIDA
ncbi:MAG: ABC transporter ATP-binding protein [Victivallales bacterium]|nr:ABC transporter ATP-binding protein [Victivallales bacterium]MCF7888685.1 ABC transporter ATP-binding protein [Victivallales bacterium]